MAEQLPSHYAAYWRRNERLIKVLLAIWLLVSLGGSILFVEPLNRFHFGRLPFGFWLAQQGSIYTFVAIIFFYAWRMDRLDREYGVNELPDTMLPPAPGH